MIRAQPNPGFSPPQWTAGRLMRGGFLRIRKARIFSKALLPITRIV